MHPAFMYNFIINIKYAVHKNTVLYGVYADVYTGLVIVL